MFFCRNAVVEKVALSSLQYFCINLKTVALETSFKVCNLIKCQTERYMICGEVLPVLIAKISHRMVTGKRKQISGITIKHILHYGHYELIIDSLLIWGFSMICIYITRHAFQSKILRIENQISRLY